PRQSGSGGGECRAAGGAVGARRRGGGGGGGGAGGKMRAGGWEGQGGVDAIGGRVNPGFPAGEGGRPIGGPGPSTTSLTTTMKRNLLRRRSRGPGTIAGGFCPASGRSEDRDDLRDHHAITREVAITC